MKTFVASMIAPNAVSSTICSLVVAIREAREQLVVHGVGVVCEAQPEGDHELVVLVEPERVGILAGVDQDPPEERRADQAVGLGRDRMAEEGRTPLTEERHDLVVERIPLEERAERGRGVRERPLHVRHPAARSLVGGCDVERSRRCAARVEGRDPRHGGHDARGAAGRAGVLADDRACSPSRPSIRASSPRRMSSPVARSAS